MYNNNTRKQRILSLVLALMACFASGEEKTEGIFLNTEYTADNTTVIRGKVLENYIIHFKIDIHSSVLL